MGFYLPGDNDWTDDDRLVAQSWVGKSVYVDLGDSFVDGGEFIDTITRADDAGLWFGGDFFSFERLAHVELR